VTAGPVSYWNFVGSGCEKVAAATSYKAAGLCGLNYKAAEFTPLCFSCEACNEIYEIHRYGRCGIFRFGFDTRCRRRSLGG
jgi:hypothetical protein